MSLIPNCAPLEPEDAAAVFEEDWMRRWRKTGDLGRKKMEERRAAKEPCFWHKKLAHGGTLLHWAALEADDEAIARLRERGVDPNARDDAAAPINYLMPHEDGREWSAAQREKKLGALRELLKFKGIDLGVKMKGVAPLIQAIKSQEAQLVQILLEAGAPIEERSESEAKAKKVSISQIDAMGPLELARRCAAVGFYGYEKKQNAAARIVGLIESEMEERQLRAAVGQEEKTKSLRAPQGRI